MNLMPALPESIFDIAYLGFAIASGIVLLKKSDGRKEISLMGIAALVLGLGDAFHLIPRVLAYWCEGDFSVALGIGKLITSVTMTAFYLLLEYIRLYRFHKGQKRMVTIALWVLAGIRIALCLFPQNAWTSPDAPVSWGIWRNIPFAVIGILTIVLWLSDAKNDRIFRFLYLAVLLSFAFYLPVVIFSEAIPLIGMLMLPKTVMYIWTICMFQKAHK